VVFIFRFRSFREVIRAGQASRDAERQAERAGEEADDEEGPPLRPPRPRGARARY
jgi:hypothetical protein